MSLQRKSVLYIKRSAGIGWAARAAIVVLLLAAVILIVYFYMDYQRKTYSNYSIIEWNELSGMENSNSVSFRWQSHGATIKDGVAYVDYTNAQIWNQPYGDGITDAGCE